VTQTKNENPTAQTAVHQAVPGADSSTRGTALFGSGQSYTGVQLNGFLSRFLANQPVRPAVSPGMTNQRSL
jgi:hypothetical protein